MKYIFAYDGGGTKTRMNVIDLQGKIVFDKITTGSNYVSSGSEHFVNIIKGLFDEAKEKLQITNADISKVFLGLSGADLQEDYDRLYSYCGPIFNEIPHTILNDAWIIMRSGLKDSYGAVCICGTGTNSAAMNKNKDMAILRALSYALGTTGGGLKMANDALHYAFRSEELTYKKTILEEEIPKYLEVESMEQVIPLFYPQRTISKQTWGGITKVLDECGMKNDEVALMILEKGGRDIALQTAGVIKQLKMESEEVPVVVGGRVFSVESPIFLETFKEVLQKEVPNFTLQVPRFTPVVGAYLFALDELNLKQTKEIEHNLLQTGGKL